MHIICQQDDQPISQSYDCSLSSLLTTDNREYATVMRDSSTKVGDEITQVRKTYKGVPAKFVTISEERAMYATSSA